jgi:thiosulfate reductase cytochrome b subunit
MARIYITPLPVRIWHWTNAFCFLVLIVTALQIRYGDIFDMMSFKTAVMVHNWVGFVLIGNFFLWLFFYLFTDKIKVYHPELSPSKYFNAAFRQMVFYGYGILRGAPNPHHTTPYNKFNALQAMSYQIIMLLLLPLQCITGLLLWDVKRFSVVVDFIGGVRVVDTVHVLLFVFFCGFIIVHIYLATLGHTPTAHIKSMITGYEEDHDEPAKGAPSAH